MDPEADDEILREVEVCFAPRLDALTHLGITLAEFEAALLVSLEQRETLAACKDVEDVEIPPLEEMLLQMGGVIYKFEDLAEVELRGWDE